MKGEPATMKHEQMAATANKQAADVESMLAGYTEHGRLSEVEMSFIRACFRLAWLDGFEAGMAEAKSIYSPQPAEASTPPALEQESDMERDRRAGKVG